MTDRNQINCRSVRRAATAHDACGRAPDAAADRHGTIRHRPWTQDHMLEGQGGNIRSWSATTASSWWTPSGAAMTRSKPPSPELQSSNQVSGRYHFMEAGRRHAPFHRDGATVGTMAVRLLAGTTNSLNYNKSPPAGPDAIPTETYVGGTKTVEVRGRSALLTHATNAHTDGDSWIYLADANVIFTGDLFYNNDRYPMIDYANGGDIRGMVRANEAFLKLATAETKTASGRGPVAGKAQVAEFRDMLATARDRMAAMVGKGMTEEEALAAKPFLDLDAKWAGGEQGSVNFIRNAYNSFKRS